MDFIDGLKPDKGPKLLHFKKVLDFGAASMPPSPAGPVTAIVLTVGRDRLRLISPAVDMIVMSQENREGLAKREMHRIGIRMDDKWMPKDSPWDETPPFQENHVSGDDSEEDGIEEKGVEGFLNS